MSRTIPETTADSLVFARTFASLGDETRLALVAKLRDGRPRSISQLSQGLKLSRQAVTKHLKVMENAGLVQCSRSGRETLFEFDPRPLAEAKSYLDSVSQQWDAVLSRLQRFVEDSPETI
jgi:DNA-binding transcriptional ArsR family regulator